MPSFKPKNIKKIKINKKNLITLDNKHKEFLNEFYTDENDNIPSLKQEKQSLKIQIEKENDTLSIEQKMDIKDRINEINENIKNLKNKKKEYFLDNSKYIFDYFENKKNISNGNGNASINQQSSKNKFIEDFFKISNCNKGENNNSKSENNNSNILQNYLTNIDDSFIDINSFVLQNNICKYCFKGELIPIEDEGLLICNICSRNIPYLI